MLDAARPHRSGRQELRRRETYRRPDGSTLRLQRAATRQQDRLGHRDFLTTFDPAITPREAASRRDFTINAMAYDPIANELLDFFGGREDLENRVLRATSALFREDPSASVCEECSSPAASI